MSDMQPAVDSMGNDVAASRELDAHHAMVPDADQNGDFDNCVVCGYGAGWLNLPGAQRGHTTSATVAEVEHWITEQGVTA